MSRMDRHAKTGNSGSPRCNKGRSAGLSLVEMLVALTVGLLLLGGLMQVWSSSRHTYRLAEAQSRIQENGRFATQMVAAELRQTRSPACQSVALGERLQSISVIACNLLNPAPGAGACAGSSAIASGLAIGYDGAQSGAGDWLSALPGNVTDGAEKAVKDRWLRGDVVVSWGAIGDGVFVDAPGGIGDDRKGTVDVQNLPSGLNAGSLALITDCKAVDVFEISDLDAAGGAGSQPAKLHFDAGVNATNQLSYAYNWRGSDHLAAAPRNRARLYPFEYKVMFVCCMDRDTGTIQSGAGDVALCNTDSVRYRPALCRWSTAANGTTSQLVADVADMRVTYDGTDNTSGKRRFRELTENPDAAWVDARGLWDSVDSLRIQLLTTWDEQVLAEESRPNGWRDNQPGDLGFGMDADRRLYQAFDVTAATRSRTKW